MSIISGGINSLWDSIKSSEKLESKLLNNIQKIVLEEPDKGKVATRQSTRRKGKKADISTII